MVKEFGIHAENKIHYIEPEDRRKLSERLDSERRFFTKVNSCSDCSEEEFDDCDDCRSAVFTTDRDRELITVYIEDESVVEGDVPATPGPAHKMLVKQLDLVVEGYFLHEHVSGRGLEIRVSSHYE